MIDYDLLIEKSEKVTKEMFRKMACVLMYSNFFFLAELYALCKNDIGSLNIFLTHLILIAHHAPLPKCFSNKNHSDAPNHH